MLTVGSFFAGVGGIDLGFEQAGQFKIVYANEFDTYPALTYNANFKTQVDVKDIHQVNGKNIPDFDVMIGGFPCQAFSIAGLRQGFNDKQGRGTLFFELVRILKEKQSQHALPKIVFFENVKNLVQHDHGNTFKIILGYLHELGYHVKYQVLNASQYGNIPQNRERIYIVGFQDPALAQKFTFPKPIPLTHSLNEYIDFKGQVDQKYYYTADNFSHYDDLIQKVNNQNTIYQWRRVYVRANKTGLCPTLTANMGTGGHNVPLIKTDYGIRKLTPRECFNLQGFPANFILPIKLSNTRLYKQAGNSVTVPVIKRIATNIASVVP